MSLEPYPVSVKLQVIGKDERIYTLPEALGLSADQTGWMPKEMADNLISTSLTIMPEENNRTRLCEKIEKWLIENAGILKDLDVDLKHVVVECHIDRHAYDGVTFLPGTVKAAVEADCGLSCMVYKLIKNQQ